MINIVTEPDIQTEIYFDRKIRSEFEIKKDAFLKSLMCITAIFQAPKIILTRKNHRQK